MNPFVATSNLVLASLLLSATPAISQPSRCADCHFANPTATAADHQGDWDRSAHRRNNIGCEACHGGDASTFDSAQAHRGILNSMNPASPVNWRNLTATCGTCHTGPYAAFKESRHFDLLSKGDNRGPGCSTCHGAAGFRRQSPKALEQQCQQCHGPRGIAPRLEQPETARNLYEALNETRDLLRVSGSLIKRVRDKTRRTQLEEARRQAEVPLVQAVQAGHQFVYDSLKERLNEARRRMETMLSQLTNPKPSAEP